jgi:hypothetical protein
MNPDKLHEAVSKTQREIWEVVQKYRSLYGDLFVTTVGQKKTYHYRENGQRSCIVTDHGYSIFDVGDDDV